MDKSLFFRRNRTAFTLIELLVVIAIIGILVYMLMPAVNAARESARTLQCKNNMRQVALGIINYEGTHGRLPTAGICRRNPDASPVFGDFNPRSGRMISWAVLILPFLEEQNLYDQFDLRETIFKQVNEPQKRHVATYLCPSDDAGRLYYQHPTYSRDIPFAKGNYAAYVGPFHIDLLMEYPGALGGGKWLEEGKGRLGQKMAEVIDGASRTIMLAEVRARDNELDQRGAWALPWPGASLLSLDIHHELRSGATYTPWDETFDSAQMPNQTDTNVDMLYDCPDPEQAQLDGMPCGKWSSTSGDEGHYLSAAPRSNHPGGVVFATMDGAVGFLTDSTDPPTLAYLIHINDGSSAEIADVAP